MDLNRTRRRLRDLGKITEAVNAIAILDCMDLIQEQAQETMEDEMRIQQNSVDQSVIESFVQFSRETLIDLLVVDISTPEDILLYLVTGDDKAIVQTATELQALLDTYKKDAELRIAQSARWLNDDLGDLEDHPF